MPPPGSHILFKLTFELFEALLQFTHFLAQRSYLGFESLDPFVFGSHLKGGWFGYQGCHNGVKIGLPGQKMHESPFFVTGLAG